MSKLKMEILGEIVVRLAADELSPNEFSTDELKSILDLLKKIPNPKWYEEMLKFLREEPCWVKNFAQKDADTTKFIAKEKFKIDISENAEVLIGSMSDDFKTWFGSKVEKSEDREVLIPRTIKRYLTGSRIFEEIGGKGRAETTLSAVYDLMKAQGRGREGVLLTNTGSNFFCVRDINDELRVVIVVWHDGYWQLYAYYFGHPERESDPGDQAFTHKQYY